MLRSSIIIIIFIFALFGAVLEVYAAPFLYQQYTIDNLSGSERVANSTYHSHREERVRTRERERNFYEGRISNLDDRGVHGRLTLKQLRRHLKRFE